MQRETIAEAINKPKLFVHQQFERWAANRPDGIALRYRNLQLSYRQLNQRANQLARLLSAQGIGREHLVVVCVEPGMEIVLALLAIFKVGAVYVPLDPTYPANRIQAILEDTEPTLIISNSALLEKLNLVRFSTLALDAVGNYLNHFSEENIEAEIESSQSVSVFYTSGTTGKPKGVVASYANLMSYIQVAQNRYLFSCDDSLPAIARFGFSISLFELLLPLASGGTLVILDRDHVLDLPRLSETLAEVTFFHAGPSLLKSLLTFLKKSHSHFESFSKVRHASSGGDMIPPEVLEDLKRIFANAEIFVIYGCSEISCMGCTYPVPRNEPLSKTYVGVPFENMIAVVLDSDLKPVSNGEVGEIHFAGEGVVKGYLNRPDLMEKKFMTIDGLRFYATGDLGRKNGNGLLEVLGRSDFQIKIRGMRIEPAEVEYHLRQAPGIRDGLVAAKNGPTGEKTLVAYVVYHELVENLEAAKIAPIRRYLADHLPDFMVPSNYVELEKLPLNHNMKVDRNALPELVTNLPPFDRKFEIREPETTSEIKIASLWQKILKKQRVGLDDNFFDLGGQSLLAVEFISDVKQSIGVVLEGMDVLRETLEVLASICDQKLGIQGERRESKSEQFSGAPVIETFHFGPHQDLFGVLYLPEGQPNSVPEAVMICIPIGQEYVRAHFVLNNLARQLAAQGIPVMRFDYYGCGDSYGDHADASFGRWRNDIVWAYQELKDRTQAKCIAGVGVRLGAMLLSSVLDRIELSRMILWDPVVDGAAFIEEMMEMQRKFHLNERNYKRGGRKTRMKGMNEIMEFVFSNDSIRGLKELTIHHGKPITTHQVITTKAGLLREIGGVGTHILNFDSAWDEVAQMNDILPDVGIVNAMLAIVNETPCLN